MGARSPRVIDCPRVRPWRRERARPDFSAVRTSPGGWRRLVAAPRPLEAGVPAQRINDGLLASVERRVLTWLAGRLPARVNSDHLTALALLAMLGVGAS